MPDSPKAGIPQRTLRETAAFRGIGLNAGEEVEVRILPAAPDAGYVFVRTDLPGRPEVRAAVGNLVDIGRRTALRSGEAEVELTEHLLAALRGFGVDNARIEVTGRELPNADGSAIPFVEMVKAAGVAEQDRPARAIPVPEPRGEREGVASAWALPEPGVFRLSFTLDYGLPYIPVQHLSVLVTPETVEKALAPSRTFILLSEVEPLRKMGLGKGANAQSMLIVGEQGIIQNELRFPDEFVRHKILDMLGDFALLPGRLEGHILGVRSGHGLHRKLLRWLEARCASATGAGPARAPAPPLPPPAARGIPPEPPGLPQAPLDAVQIQKILPHRYPFLMIDRVTELVGFEHAKGVKNVGNSEPWCTGHFPGNPIMPGVLQLEAMAQLAATMILRKFPPGSMLAVFAGIDGVRFRRAVRPGDVLALEATTTRMRERTGIIEARATVDGELASQATITWALVPASGSPA